MFAILAVFLAAAPLPDSRLADVIEVLNHQLDEIDSTLAVLDRELDTDTLIPPAMPQLGFVLRSSEEVTDNDHLHPTYVVAVYTGGPADLAGVRPGDRILAVGQRRIEHETTDIVYLLIAQSPDPVRLTVQHGTDPPVALTMTVRALDCIGQGVRRIDKANIRKQAATIRSLSQDARSMIRRYANNPVILGKVGKMNTDIIKAVVTLGDNIIEEIHASIIVTCQAKFADP